ncbi:MAG: preprotein translocase subunit SecG [Holophagaceae bacterium]|nr:preprotein translocase subunit SecG [Holophagaceae bacterium]
MSGFLLTIHIILSVLLVAVILLQPGAKGGGLGSSFGGGGANTAFGAQGAAPVLAKITYYVAACLLATSLLIEYRVVRENRSVLDKLPESKPAAAAPKPATPAMPVPAAPAGTTPATPAGAVDAPKK